MHNRSNSGHGLRGEGMASMKWAQGIAVGVIGIAALTACGSGADPSPSMPMSMSVNPSTSATAPPAVNTGPHNSEDVVFAQEMIPHHEQAIVMAKMVPSHTNDQELIALAAQIEAAQAPEIAQMQAWLTQWGEPSASSGGHDMHGGDPGAHGMMSAEQMSQLEQARGAGFDTMWLRMMIAHHEGAVVMARQELAGGENPDARALAQAIIDSQTKEIAQMQQMLNS